jgi:phosphinothricin acetyltransferase
MSVVVRPAAETDAAALSRIYAPYTATPITFECHAPDAAEFVKRIRSFSAVYPFLVCEADGRVTGYCYAHRLREREAYDWDAELSIYLDPDCTGRGTGRALYKAVLALLTLQGFKNAYGSMVVPNPPSEHLHLACGFTETGTWHRSGHKLGNWYDLKWFEKQIGAYEAEPAPIIPFPLLAPGKTAGILEACSRAIAQPAK